jgi:hypothetical protein
MEGKRDPGGRKQVISYWTALLRSEKMGKSLGKEL